MTWAVRRKRPWRLEQKRGLTVKADADDVSCFGISDGVIVLFVSGGTESYNYIWNTGDTTIFIADLMSGDYSVTITDTDDCYAIEEFTLTEPPVLTTTVASTNPSNISAGSIGVEVEGGIEPYSIVWNTGSTDFELTGLSAGSYTYQITDANGCLLIETVVLDFVNGLSDVDDGMEVVVYPNPTNGMLFIESDLMLKSMSVVDVLGRSVREVELMQGGDVLEVNVGGLAPGVYFLRFGTDDGEVVRRVVVE